MKEAHIDCFSGVSGDMLLGAFLDLGWPFERLRSLSRRLGLTDTLIKAETVMRCGIRGINVTVISRDAQPLRALSDIVHLLKNKDLSQGTADKAIEVFNVLAEAEAKVHGCRPDEVHFHEIGAVDTIIDVTGVVEAISSLGIERLTCSPLPLPRGWVKCEHGRLPLPAPASLEILRGAPIYGVDLDEELVTPTGAALVAVLSDGFGNPPAMHLEGIGYGAGARDVLNRANVLRVLTGRGRDCVESQVSEIRTHIDDMNPEWYEHLMARLFSGGALDVGLSPIQMKKNRPGIALTVVAPVGKEADLSGIIFEESTTTGVRISRCDRYTLLRRQGIVRTRWGMVRAKMISRPGGRMVITPEYDSCRGLAKELNIPIGLIYEEVARSTPEDFVTIEDQDAAPGISLDAEKNPKQHD